MRDGRGRFGAERIECGIFRQQRIVVLRLPVIVIPLLLPERKRGLQLHVLLNPTELIKNDGRLVPCATISFISTTLIFSSANRILIVIEEVTAMMRLVWNGPMNIAARQSLDSALPDIAKGAMPRR